MLIIKEVAPNSVGSELELKSGDKILQFDSRQASDLIDYIFYDSKTEFEMLIETADGEEVEYEVEKDEEESLGLTFESDNLEIKTCRNKCIFCFVDQMPTGMRDALYVKDDDYRQSFLCGNYVTLTNLNDVDINRIIEYKLSPLYVSVHTMNSELRAKMTNNRFAGRIAEQLERLKRGGITVHTQVVLVRGVNDGAELEKTAVQLNKLYPSVKTLAVVPCGTTRYRDGLYKIKEMDEGYCNCLIEQVKILNERFARNFITLADEIYIKANREVESFEKYGEFEQIENGVGMIAKFKREVEDSLKPTVSEKHVLIVTGVSAENVVREAAQNIEKYVKCLKTNVIAAKNYFFGETVTCTGLLTGGDIIKAVIESGEQFDELILSKNCFKEFEKVFLDGMTLNEMSEKIGKPVTVTDGTGEGFFAALSAALPSEFNKESEIK